MYIHICMHAREFVRADVCVGEGGGVHAYMHKYRHICIQTDMSALQVCNCSLAKLN
jgi:hypothetical protein